MKSLQLLIFLCPVLFKKKKKKCKNSLSKFLIILILHFTPTPSITLDFKIHSPARNILAHSWSGSGLCHLKSFFLHKFCCLIQKQTPVVFSYKPDRMWLLRYRDLSFFFLFKLKKVEYFTDFPSLSFPGLDRWSHLLFCYMKETAWTVSKLPSNFQNPVTLYQLCPKD